MTRAMIIGNAGGGKSTLCAAIAARHELPHLAVDQIQWGPGWSAVDPGEVEAIHETWLARDRWLIDSFGASDLVAARMDAADTIIFVDHPFRVHLWWATKRQVRSIFFGRDDAPVGCRMWPVTFRLYAMMLRFHRRARPWLKQEINRRADSARIIHIRSPKELAAFAADPA
ncbi:MAG: flagellar protein FlaR [Pseudomonadota bacterium]